MLKDNLKYKELIRLISPLSVKGKSESVTFLNWFLESIYRLDPVSADDAICDSANDKGIDAIYVDTNNEELHFFQCKIRQSDTGTIGDVSLKTFIASVKQFDTADKVQAILTGDADQGLKNLIERIELRDLIRKGYKPVAVYVSNEIKDKATIAYQEMEPLLKVYDRKEIADNFIETNQQTGVTGEFTFDLSYVQPLKMSIGSNQNFAEVFVFPSRALELVALDGIEDTSLFTKNVRFDLGNTPVNKSIKRSIEQKAEHRNFPLFHNGVIILCESAVQVDDKLTIRNYSVVNGAQSITTFFKSKAKLSDDLRVLVRVIALTEDALAVKITEYSNNQNAIKPRDLRSNDALMTRLQTEMSVVSDDYFFEIKRGEKAPPDKIVISNEAAGRALLAIDLREPYSCHQVYKIFDERYSGIFGRKEVTAHRIIHVMNIMKLIESNLDSINSKPLAHYALTKYFLASVLSQVLSSVETSAKVMRDPLTLNNQDRQSFYSICGSILASLIIDLNYEVKNKEKVFDYKSDLKSPKQIEELTQTLLRSYQKDVARSKADSFSNWSPATAPPP